jgi:hypothetical protein
VRRRTDGPTDGLIDTCENVERALEEVAKMIAAKVVLAVAALNLLFLASELALNVFRASFG